MPKLTHLQFLVINALGRDELPGIDLREKIANDHRTKSLVSFYMLMARLEDSKFVKGRYVLAKVGNYRAKERWYETTDKGMRAWRESIDWYRNA